MLNYLKSELYRLFHSRTIYTMTAVLCGLALFMNAVLFIFSIRDSDFPYGTTWFSLSNFTSFLNLTLISALVVVSLLFSGEKKNGTLKNSLAYGISRNDLFMGKCIVCTIAGLLSLIVILFVFIASAYLLLENSGILPVRILLKGTVFAMPSALAAVVLAVALFSVCDNEVTVILWWFGIMWFLPEVLYYLGLRVELFSLISQWLPSNLFSKEVVLNNGGYYNCLWDTSYGAVRCIVSGVVSMIVFGIFGMVKFKKKDI